jgi:hypothetical protein
MRAQSWSFRQIVPSEAVFVSTIKPKLNGTTTYFDLQCLSPRLPVFTGSVRCRIKRGESGFAVEALGLNDTWFRGLVFLKI